MASKKPPPVAPSPSDLRRRVERAIADGRFQTAYQLAKQLAKELPSPQHQQLLLECQLGRAEQLDQAGHHQDAGQLLSQIVDGLGDDPALVERVASCLARAGRMEQVQQLIARLPNSTFIRKLPSLMLDAALTKGAAGRSIAPPETLADFDRVIAAFAAMEAGQDDSCREQIQGIGLQSPALEWKLLIRGLLAYYGNDDVKANENWTRLNPQRPPARLAAPFRQEIDPAYAALQPPSTQASLRKQYERIQGNDPGPAREISIVLSTRRDSTDVPRLFDKHAGWIRQQPAEVQTVLADEFYWWLIDFAETPDLNVYLRVFGAPPLDPEFLRMRSMILDQTDDVDESLDCLLRYELWVANHPNLFPGPDHARVRSALWQRIGDLAIEQLGVMSQTRRAGNSVALKPPKPQQCFEKAIELAPDWIDPHIAMGNLAAEHGRIDDVLAAGERLLRHFPDHLETHRIMAKVALALDDPDRALSVMDRAMASDPGDQEIQAAAEKVLLCAGFRELIEGRLDRARILAGRMDSIQRDTVRLMARAIPAACDLLEHRTAEADHAFADMRSDPKTGAAVGLFVHLASQVLPVGKSSRATYKKQLDVELAEPQSLSSVSLRLSVFQVMQDHGFASSSSTKIRTKLLAPLKNLEYDQLVPEDVEAVGKVLIDLEQKSLLKKLADSLIRKDNRSPWGHYFQAMTISLGRQTATSERRIRNQLGQALFNLNRILRDPERDRLKKLIEEKMGSLPENHSPLEFIFNMFNQF